MRIVTVRCSRFAGLQETGASFAPGLNVLVGPNEAGKSTLVESILATLFQSHKLSGRSKRDKEFADRFFPHPEGDYAEAELIFKAASGNLRLRRCWSYKSPFVELEQDGICIRDDNAVEDQLRGLLSYGEGTYAGVVFARQNDLRSIFERITQEEGISENVGEVLRRAVMEMDGVNMDRLSRRIDERLLEYSERWDDAGERPENNRGIANPFKKGVGKVLESYYEMEGHRIAMQSASEAEDRLASETDRLHELTGRLHSITQRLAEFSRIEPTLIQRAELTAKEEGLRKEQETLRELAVSWPESDIRKGQALERVAALSKEEESLQQRIAHARQAGDIKRAQELLHKHDTLIKAIEGLERDRNGYMKFDDERVLALREYQKTCVQCGATLEAATLVGRIIKSVEPVTIHAGLSGPEIVAEGDTFSANGSIRLAMGSSIEMEVRSGDIDFEAVQARFQQADSAKSELFRQLDITSLEEAETGNRELKRITAELKRSSEALSELIGDRNIQLLRKQVDDQIMQGLESEADWAALEASLNGVRRQKGDAQSECSRLEGLVESWVRQYGSRDRMLDAFGDVSAEMKVVRMGLEGLPALPSEFLTIQLFQQEMSSLRSDKESITQQINEIHRIQDSLREKMSGLSAEELKGLFLDAEKEFEERKRHLKRLQAIRDTLVEVRADLNQRSAKPLEEKFTDYLNRLTDGKYQGVQLGDDYRVEISREFGRALPSRLLSAGTLDAAALAFKLAILDMMFQEGEGLAVLDDCLVNLDPARQERAAEIIKEYAKKHQVIFTTCSPEIAQLLGGNRVSFS